ncbi:MAG: glutamine-hydrolyzing GMP synthase, partial [Elusimicrobiales bacterium]
MADLILILDFGSQYTQLIAKRLRRLSVYCEILPYHTALKDIISKKPNGIIFSGGPQSVYSKDAPKINWNIEDLNIPILGICYGMQIVAHLLGGKTSPGMRREYGHTLVKIVKDSILFKGVSRKTSVWMSHGDEVKKIPQGFEITALTENGVIGAMESTQKKIYAVQFHPEVEHTLEGKKILENFAFNICSVKNLFKLENFIDEVVSDIKKTVGDSKAICALSGGVDSSVAAFLAHKAIGEKLVCIFVDTGLLRIGDRQRIEDVFSKKFDFNIKIVDASDIFLMRLKGVRDPER